MSNDVHVMTSDEFFEIKKSIPDICCRKTKYAKDREFLTINKDMVFDIIDNCSLAKTRKMLNDRGYISCSYSYFAQMIKSLKEGKAINGN